MGAHTRHGAVLLPVLSVYLVTLRRFLRYALLSSPTSLAAAAAPALAPPTHHTQSARVDVAALHAPRGPSLPGPCVCTVYFMSMFQNSECILKLFLFIQQISKEIGGKVPMFHLLLDPSASLVGGPGSNNLLSFGSSRKHLYLTSMDVRYSQ